MGNVFVVNWRLRLGQKRARLVLGVFGSVTPIKYIKLGCASCFSFLFFKVKLFTLCRCLMAADVFLSRLRAGDESELSKLIGILIQYATVNLAAEGRCMEHVVVLYFGD